MNAVVTRTRNRTLSIEEAGAILGISRPTSYKLAKRDEFPVPIIRLGKRMVVSRDAVEALLCRQKDDSDGQVA